MLSDKQDQLFIITAPSGAGKTSLIKNILSHAEIMRYTLNMQWFMEIYMAHQKTQLILF